MSIMTHPAAAPRQAAPTGTPSGGAATHPLVAAILAVADRRGDFDTTGWAAVVDGFGPAMDGIADDLANADAYASGLRDFEARTAAAAEHQAAQLRADAAHTAAFVASLILAGAA